jgi:hypothetical protein
MKYLFILLICLPIRLFSQNDRAFPTEAQLGKTYAQCLVFPQDTLINNQKYPYPVPPVEWEEARFMVQESHTLKTIIKMPIFDTILIKIPVDKTTHLANIPNEYTIGKTYLQRSSSSGEWSMRKDSEIRFLDTLTCQIWIKNGLPYFTVIPILQIKSMAHQLRIDSSDTLIFKQIVEKSPILIQEKVIPAEYQTVLIRKAPHQFWSQWREVMICEKMNVPTIGKIQEALKRLNYYHGEINNQLDKSTKKAISKYQKDKKLPIGNLNVETLKSLGLGD